MVNIIAFEGADYSGKTSTLKHLSGILSGDKSMVFNQGPVYRTNLIESLFSLAASSDELEKEFCILQCIY